jgi:hypothetical protein
MDEQTVRAQAEAFGQALVDGDIDRAIGHFSQELRRNTGEVIALLPLPVSDVAVESVEHSGSGENVVLRLVGESEASSILTRWKDRDDQPTIIEVSHLSTTQIAADEDVTDEAAEAQAQPGA